MNRQRILIIDDETSFTRMVKLNLELRGNYAVLEVNRPHEAVRVARAFQPDLILLDVIMPGMDGGELAERLRADVLLRRIPILFLTASVSPAEAGVSGLDSGGFTFLAKPVALTDLLHAIARQLEGAGTLSEPLVSDEATPQLVPA